ncbi:hypothetical protein cyc_02314 [Cyclospora cayetanensis]|uniref:Uncharacterized protein n=1 Tax=Cyclospora cayetanensis TaxID=88456 RepID=A0A1D3CWI1_9EIME|nr:hypothetical protein cyc_02314 [Cyclospora cayetanensis]
MHGSLSCCNSSSHHCRRRGRPRRAAAKLKRLLADFAAAFREVEASVAAASSCLIETPPGSLSSCASASILSLGTSFAEGPLELSEAGTGVDGGAANAAANGAIAQYSQGASLEEFSSSGRDEGSFLWGGEGGISEIPVDLIGEAQRQAAEPLEAKRQSSQHEEITGQERLLDEEDDTLGGAPSLSRNGGVRDAGGGRTAAAGLSSSDRDSSDASSVSSDDHGEAFSESSIKSSGSQRTALRKLELWLGRLLPALRLDAEVRKCVALGGALAIPPSPLALVAAGTPAARSDLETGAHKHGRRNAYLEHPDCLRPTCIAPSGASYTREGGGEEVTETGYPWMLQQQQEEERQRGGQVQPAAILLPRQLAVKQRHLGSAVGSPWSYGPPEEGGEGDDDALQLAAPEACITWKVSLEGDALQLTAAASPALDALIRLSCTEASGQAVRSSAEPQDTVVSLQLKRVGALLPACLVPLFRGRLLASADMVGRDVCCCRKTRHDATLVTCGCVHTGGRDARGFASAALQPCKEPAPSVSVRIDGDVDLKANPKHFPAFKRLATQFADLSASTSSCEALYIHPHLSAEALRLVFAMSPYTPHLPAHATQHRAFGIPYHMSSWSGAYRGAFAPAGTAAAELRQPQQQVLWRHQQPLTEEQRLPMAAKQQLSLLSLPSRWQSGRGKPQVADWDTASGLHASASACAHSLGGISRESTEYDGGPSLAAAPSGSLSLGGPLSEGLRAKEFGDLTVLALQEGGQRIVDVGCPLRVRSLLKLPVELIFLAETDSTADWRCELRPGESQAVPLWPGAASVSVIVKLRSEAGPVWTASSPFRAPGRTFLLSATVSPQRTFVCSLKAEAALGGAGLLLTLSEPLTLANALPMTLHVDVAQELPRRSARLTLSPGTSQGLTLFDWNRPLTLRLCLPGSDTWSAPVTVLPPPQDGLHAAAAAAVEKGSGGLLSREAEQRAQDVEIPTSSETRRGSKTALPTSWEWERASRETEREDEGNVAGAGRGEDVATQASVRLPQSFGGATLVVLRPKLVVLNACPFPLQLKYIGSPDSAALSLYPTETVECEWTVPFNPLKCLNEQIALHCSDARSTRGSKGGGNVARNSRVDILQLRAMEVQGVRFLVFSAPFALTSCLYGSSAFGGSCCCRCSVQGQKGIPAALAEAPRLVVRNELRVSLFFKQKGYCLFTQVPPCSQQPIALDAPWGERILRVAARRWLQQQQEQQQQQGHLQEADIEPLQLLDVSLTTAGDISFFFLAPCSHDLTASVVVQRTAASATTAALEESSTLSDCRHGESVQAAASLGAPASDVDAATDARFYTAYGGSSVWSLVQTVGTAGAASLLHRTRWLRLCRYSCSLSIRMYGPTVSLHFRGELQQLRPPSEPPAMSTSLRTASVRPLGARGKSQPNVRGKGGTLMSHRQGAAAASGTAALLANTSAAAVDGSSLGGPLGALFGGLAVLRGPLRPRAAPSHRLLFTLDRIDLFAYDAAGGKAYHVFKSSAAAAVGVAGRTPAASAADDTPLSLRYAGASSSISQDDPIDFPPAAVVPWSTSDEGGGGFQESMQVYVELLWVQEASAHLSGFRWLLRSAPLDPAASLAALDLLVLPWSAVSLQRLFVLLYQTAAFHVTRLRGPPAQQVAHLVPRLLPPPPPPPPADLQQQFCRALSERQPYAGYSAHAPSPALPAVYGSPHYLSVERAPRLPQRSLRGSNRPPLGAPGIEDQEEHRRREVLPFSLLQASGGGSGSLPLPPSPAVSEISSAAFSSGFSLPRAMLPHTPLELSRESSSKDAGPAAPTTGDTSGLAKQENLPGYLQEDHPSLGGPSHPEAYFVSGGLYPVVAQLPEDLFS